LPTPVRTPPDTPSSFVSNPPGYGYALLANNPATAALPPILTLSGALADGTAISQTVPIGEDNGIPVCLNPYTAADPGLLFGRLSLSASPAPVGSLTWIKQASASGMFKAGFTNGFLAVIGSPWSNSVPLASVILPGSQLILSNGNLTAPVALGVSVSNTNLVPGPAAANFSASVNTNNGQLTLALTNGAGAGRVVLSGRGAVLQDNGAGGGYFVIPSAASPTNAGSIILSPP
jgi:hypothetical protein